MIIRLALVIIISLFLCSRLKSRSETQCFPTQPNPAYGQLGVPHEDDGQYELCDAATSKLGEQ